MEPPHQKMTREYGIRQDEYMKKMYRSAVMNKLKPYNEEDNLGAKNYVEQDRYQ